MVKVSKALANQLLLQRKLLLKLLDVQLLSKASKTLMSKLKVLALAVNPLFVHSVHWVFASTLLLM